MDYALFVLLTAILFLRPAELIPALIGWPIYNYTILACLIASAPRISEVLQPEQLKRQPISICVLGVLAAVAASHLVRFDLWSTRYNSIEFGKVLIYYFLLIANVNSLPRLRQFLNWIILFTFVLTFLAVGHFHGYFEIEAIDTVTEWAYTDTGERYAIYRMQATGIFADPNDLSMILVVGMCLCGMGFLDPSSSVIRFFWLLPFTFLAYALTLTQSRGGFLAMVIAGLSLLYSRYGARKALIPGAVLLPLAIILFGGRQTSFSDGLSGGTGHSRVELWSAGLQALKSQPLFGIGYGHYFEWAGQVAHNSYVQSLVELGILGGATFIGAYWLAIRVMWKLGKQRRWMTMVTGSPGLAYIHPFLIAITVGYMVSMISLSRAYVIPTYLFLGLITAYQNIASRRGISTGVELNGREIFRILVISVGYIIVTYVYIRVGFR